MLVICLFDITCDKRRTKVNKVLQGYGERCQYSVYECVISTSQLRRLQKEIKDIIEGDDRVNYYPLCGKDIEQRKASGCGIVSWPERYIIC